MGAQVLVDEQGVERRRVEAGEKHVDDDDEVDLALFELQRQVLVVVLELVGRSVVTGAEGFVVVLDRVVEKVARTLVESAGFELFLTEQPVSVRLVGGVTEDDADLEFLVARLLERTLALHSHERVVVAFGGIDGCGGEEGVEAAHPFSGKRVVFGAFRFLVEVVEHVVDDLPHPFRREQGLLGVDRRDLLVGDRADPHRIDVVDAERQHVLVADGIHDRVRIQLLAERLLGGLQLRVAAAAGVHREDRRAGEAEQVVPLERLRDRRMHIAELRSVALIEDDDHVPAIDRVPLVGSDEGRELLDRRDDNPRSRVLKLLLQHRGRRVRIRGALLEPVVLAHRLVVEILAVDDEQHLLHARHPRGE